MLKSHSWTFGDNGRPDNPTFIQLLSLTDPELAWTELFTISGEELAILDPILDPELFAVVNPSFFVPSDDNDSDSNSVSGSESLDVESSSSSSSSSFQMAGA